MLMLNQLLALDVTSLTIITIISCIVCLGGGVGLGALLYKNYRNKKVGSTQAQAQAILDYAREEANKLKREAINEARDEARKLKQENERIFRERNAELAKQENRLSQKEDALEKKEELLLQILEYLCIPMPFSTSERKCAAVGSGTNSEWVSGVWVNVYLDHSGNCRKPNCVAKFSNSWNERQYPPVN